MSSFSGERQGGSSIPWQPTEGKRPTLRTEDFNEALDVTIFSVHFRQTSTPSVGGDLLPDTLRVVAN